MTKQFTAIIEQEGDGYVATCPEVGVVSQGDTVDEARDNLKEALELFLNLLRTPKSRGGHVAHFM